MIEGVRIIPLQQFHDYRGKVMKMMDVYNLDYPYQGEIYFSSIHPNIVKGWHLHRQMELNYACIYGKIQLALVDERLNSPTCFEIMEIYLSPEEYKLVHVPPLVLNAFKGLGNTDSIVANLASQPYDENEINRFPLEHVEYDWFKKGQ